MEWTLESFYNSGGTTLLIDRISASLGIHASTIKIVSVYEGSLIVDYNIYTSTDDTFQLEQIEQTQTQQIATNSINFGAPVLDTTVNTKDVVKDGVLTAQGYTPIIITPTITNSGSNYQVVSAPKIATNTQLSLDASSTQSEGTFNPDISIVEEAILNPISTEEVRDNFVGAKSNSTMTILLASLVVLALILIAIIGRFLYMLTRKQNIDAEVIAKQKENEAWEQECAAKATETSASVFQTEMSSQKILSNQYGQQYDANHDFAIFNTQEGGPQTLTQKMNLADAAEGDNQAEESVEVDVENLPEDKEISEE